MNFKQISRIQDSNPLEQAAMNILVRGKAAINNHSITKEGEYLFIDGEKIASIPEKLTEAIDLILKELKKLDDKITDSQVTDAFENIRKHFGTGKAFSLEQLKKSGYNKIDDGKQVGLQLYSPWAKENIDKVVDMLYSQFSKQHNYNTSPKATKSWIKEFVELGIKDQPEGAFAVGFGVIDNWLENLKKLFISQVYYQPHDESSDPASHNSQLA